MTIALMKRIQMRTARKVSLQIAMTMKMRRKEREGGEEGVACHTALPAQSRNWRRRIGVPADSMALVSPDLYSSMILTLTCFTAWIVSYNGSPHQGLWAETDSKIQRSSKHGS
jgi:hypothetical protein